MQVRLPPAAAQALTELALEQRRDARAQAELLLIAALHRRGLVSRDGLDRIDRAHPDETSA